MERATGIEEAIDSVSGSGSGEPSDFDAFITQKTLYANFLLPFWHGQEVCMARGQVPPDFSRLM